MSGTHDRLDERALRARLATRELGRELHVHDTLASTNDEALRLGKVGAPHGTVVLADCQTAGRGRRGRSWASPPGLNLHASILLRPAIPPQRAPELVSVAAVAFAEALGALGVPVRIKWPNDLELEGRKLAGILTELSADGGRIAFVVIGVGVNANAVAADLPAELRPIATSMRERLGRPVDRTELAAALLGSLEAWLGVHAAEGFAKVRERYRALSSTIGARVRLLEPDREVEGVAEDIDETGALFLRRDDGVVERALTGDVTSLRQAR